MNKEEIEELKDFTIDLTDIDELSLGLEVCSKKSNMVIQEFADTIIQLQQENQELNKKYENAVADYETTMFEKEQLNKQLEEYKNSQSCSFVNICKNVKIANYNQQKEFIKYMNDIIKELESEDVDDEDLKDYIIQRIDTFKEILSKYKSIIGGKDDNNTTL